MHPCTVHSRVHRSSAGAAALLLTVLLGVLPGVWCVKNPVSPDPLTLAVSGDSVVVIHDTLVLRAAVNGAATRDVRYLWRIDDAPVPDTSSHGVFTRVVSVADTGAHIVIVKAIARDGGVSPDDTVRFRVIYRRPVIALVADTLGLVGTPYTVHCAMQKGVSAIERIYWYRNDPQSARATIDTVLAWTWKAADTGIQQIVAWALDRDGIASLCCTLSVRVAALLPTVSLSASPQGYAGVPWRATVKAAPGVSAIERVEWYLDSAAAVVSTIDTVIHLQWKPTDTGTHLLIARAIDRDRLWSKPESLVITVSTTRPVLAPLPDTAVKINTRLALPLSARDSLLPVIGYSCYIDRPDQVVSTNGDTITTFWQRGDTGTHLLVVQAINSIHVASVPDTALITVTCASPTVRVFADSVVPVKTSCVFTAAAEDADGVVREYHWSVDNGPWLITRTSVLPWTFASDAIGVHTVQVFVIDDDALLSAPDTALFRVISGAPIVVAMNDTTISSLDSLLVTCTALDANGSVVRYLWDMSGSGWNDSTTVPQYRVRYDGRKTVRIVVAARDNDGLLGVDTVTVTFNRPPDTIIVRAPRLRSDTCTLSLVRPAYSVEFDFEARDPDEDTIEYELAWGTNPDSLVGVYRGPDTRYTHTVESEGVYHWRLDARDRWKHIRSVRGTFVALKEYRICFIGHSIVAGYGGNDTLGGFRGGVLDSLRKTLRPTARLKAVGPATTPHMSRSTIDDSCLAVSATTAKEIFLLLNSGATSLTADIWVFLIGANDAFSYNERYYANLIMDIMINRNIEGRIYVLNSPPLDTFATTHALNLPGFNQFIADSVAAKASRGARMYLVDAFSAMTVNGRFNPAWNSDYVHPNQTGYQRLVNAIYTRMRNSQSRAIPLQR